jgi:glycosyltransferase involved in cell wall biosynthesis
LPVVSTDVGETRRLIGESLAGRLVKDRDPEAFRSAIEDLLKEPPNRGICQRQVSSFQAGKVLETVYHDYRALKGEGS